MPCADVSTHSLNLFRPYPLILNVPISILILAFNHMPGHVALVYGTGKHM